MTSSPTLHFVLFPWPAQGHLIPMVDIARMLAERDVTVTIVTTPVNSNRIKPVIDRATKANLKIQVLDIQFPYTKAGLPEGYESFDMITSVAQVVGMFTAMKLLSEPAEELVLSLYPRPSCIISDGGFAWTNRLAKRLNIPVIIFYGPGCFASLCIHIVNNSNINILDGIESDSEYFALPGMPDRIEVTKPQALSWGKGNTKETKETFERTQEAEKAAFGIVVNSFNELEPKYVEAFAKETGKNVWCIGPVSLSNTRFEDIAERGNTGSNNRHDCLKWLDSREPRSVVYVCFGSLSSAFADQAIELALGLESSNMPFVWFVRRTSDEFEKWVSDEGYEERIKDRGVMVRGWAPQVLILSHRAVGGFLTHCGWNSTVEAVCAGIPMVTWPHFADQFLNERFIVDVLKIGVKIGAEFPITYRGKDRFDMMVKRETIKTAVEGLMNDEDEAETRRIRANELAEMAKRAMEEGGSSRLNMTLMIEAVTKELTRKATIPF